MTDVLMTVRMWYGFRMIGLIFVFVAQQEIVLARNNAIFSCSFTQDACGMVNQASAKWNKEFLTIGGRNGYAMVVRGNEAKNHFARLLTPDLSSQGARSACMRFLYFIDDRKPASLAVIKQGFVTKYLFGTARKTTDHWEYAEVDFEFLGDKAMFYFEADTRVQEYGNSVVAFTDLTITGGPCQGQQRRYIG
ncbi:hypothetical protein JTE90_028510 [Oedothorax gibbosus]|uniref:MAM domain-containing protein n=1 Tax=Oedothorax gibbosus TaxID=931172 RepID=A0AAV6VX92_9ARAC|nr:hypothetical protein JTE90_028510 [Oedothorax gibbosus]